MDSNGFLRLKWARDHMPVNAHTHIGDSFIKDEPIGDLPEIVGPGGFKHRQLENSSDGIIMEGIKNSTSFMEKSGILSYFDFRGIFQLPVFETPWPNNFW